MPRRKPGRGTLFSPQQEETIRGWIDDDGKTTVEVAALLIDEEWIDRTLGASTLIKIAERAKIAKAKAEKLANEIVNPGWA